MQNELEHGLMRGYIHLTRLSRSWNQFTGAKLDLNMDWCAAGFIWQDSYVH